LDADLSAVIGYTQLDQRIMGEKRLTVV